MGNRPSKFNDSVKLRILELASEGATDKQIAKAIGISQQTLDNWKRRDPNFYESLKEAKDVADQLVEACLFQRAIGYRCPEIKVFCDAKSGMITTKVVSKHYPPDVTAQVFWLKNRKPAEWRERTGRDGDTHDAPANEQVKELATWLMRLSSGEKV